jgi:hypothetical protein
MTGTPFDWGSPLCRYTSMGNRKQPRLTLASLKVLRVFLENPNQQLAGVEIQKLSGVPPVHSTRLCYALSRRAG